MNAESKHTGVLHAACCILHFRDRRAFTLAELLVAVMIFIVISGMLLANFRQSRSGDAVRNAALAFSANVERLRADAFGGSSAIGARAYGVHLDRAHADRYILFGDRDDGTVDAYDAGEELVNGVMVLPTGVTITTLTPADVVDVTIVPPLGRVAVTPSSTIVRVTFAGASGVDAHVVTINRVSGQVSAE